MCSFVLVCASKAKPALNSGIIFSFEKTVSGFNTAVWLCPCGSSGNQRRQFSTVTVVLAIYQFD